MKEVFKGAVVDAIKREVFKQYYEGLVGGGMRAEIARLQVARKIGAIVLAVWKRAENLVVCVKFSKKSDMGFPLFILTWNMQLAYGFHNCSYPVVSVRLV